MRKAQGFPCFSNVYTYICESSSRQKLVTKDHLEGTHIFFSSSLYISYLTSLPPTKRATSSSFLRQGFFTSSSLLSKFHIKYSTDASISSIPFFPLTILCLFLFLELFSLILTLKTHILFLGYTSQEEGYLHGIWHPQTTFTHPQFLLFHFRYLSLSPFSILYNFCSIP